MFNYNVPIVVVHATDGGDHRIAMNAIDGTDQFFLPVDADIEEGDAVEQLLPNGKTRTVRITKVDVLQSPFPGGNSLNHTEAHYTTALPDQTPVRSGDTFHVHATNVQVATGDGSHQTMTVGQTADHVVSIIHGIGEILSALGLVLEREEELAQVQQEATEGIAAAAPDATAVRRFYEWAVDCVKQGGTAAAVTAASNGMLHDAEALVRAVHG